MKEYIEVRHKASKQVDRYELDGISADLFIDTFYRNKGIVSVVITEQDFILHPNMAYSLELDVKEAGFKATTYIAVHESEELEKEWNDLISNNGSKIKL